MQKRSTEENEKFLSENEITSKGHNIPRPVTTFEESSLPKYLIDQLVAEPKYIKPSPI